MSIYLHLNRKTWTRIMFKINSFNGNIQKLFNPRDIFYKAKPIEVESVLNKIEYETDNFKMLRIYTYIKYFITFLLFNAALAVILLFSIFYDRLIGCICIAILLILTLSLCLWCCFVYRRIIKELQRQSNGVIGDANENLFYHNRLYMMANYEKQRIVLYILPKELRDIVRIHNYIDCPNIDSQVEHRNGRSYIKRQRASAYDSKYSNFSFNHITNVHL